LSRCHGADASLPGDRHRPGYVMFHGAWVSGSRQQLDTPVNLKLVGAETFSEWAT